MTVRQGCLLLAMLLAFECRAQDDVQIDATAQTSPFPHFWEQMFGSGRAILALRESYRNDLRAVKQVTDFRYVSFHAILHDEVGVYNEEEHGNPVYNFAYVDEIYDGQNNNMSWRSRARLRISSFFTSRSAAAGRIIRSSRPFGGRCRR
jgi:hypothetical protein